MTSRRATLVDVAKLAGVSRATAARALTAPELLSRKTLAAVTGAISTLGYVSDGAARTLASGRSNMVGAVVPTLLNSVFARAIHHLQVGLADGRIFDKGLLDRAEQELKRQYLTRGRYAANVSTTVTPLERNRVALNFRIEEGEIAKIRQISIIGNQAFSEKTLQGLLAQRTPGWLTWYSKADQYSRQKLAGDD